jgi:ankyrin repeat protein
MLFWYKLLLLRLAKAEVAQALLSAGADPDATASGSGATPLHVAIAEGHLAVAEVGLCIVSCASICVMTCVGLCVCVVDAAAAASGKAEVAQALLSAGADPDATASGSGATSLHVAIAEGHLAVLEVGLWKSFYMYSLICLRFCHGFCGFLCECVVD